LCGRFDYVTTDLQRLVAPSETVMAWLLSFFMSSYSSLTNDGTGNTSDGGIRPW
jgi:hypothetical protein